MAEPVEVAIQKALTDRLILLAGGASSPALAALPLALPEIDFTTPEARNGAAWLKADFMPAPTIPLALSDTDADQYQGIFQVSVFHVRGQGEYRPARIASAVIEWFQRGTVVAQDGFQARVFRRPWRGGLIIDGAWAMIPVSVPYQAFV